MPLHKAVTLLEDKTSDVYLPLLKPVVDKAQEMDTVLTDGLAIFREGKYVGDLDADETRALLFLTGQAESGDLVVEGDSFGKASLELIKADTKFTTEMKTGCPPTARRSTVYAISTRLSARISEACRAKCAHKLKLRFQQCWKASSGAQLKSA